MQKKKLAPALATWLLLSSLFTFTFIIFTFANFSPVLPPDNIIIEADGSVAGTDKIVRNGDVYTFTDNISGTMTIQGNSASNMSSALAVHKSNIVIDGAGFTLQGNGGQTGIDMSNGVCNKPSDREIWNVTIKNLRITNCTWGIRCEFGGNHTFYGDYISNDFVPSDEGGNLSWTSLGIVFWGSSGNNISYCTIGGSPAVYMHFACSNNIVTESNIVFGVSLAISGNETFDKNYWSDYLTRYPNATELDFSGIGDVPYMFQDSQFEKEKFQDSHPLLSPVIIPHFSSTLPTITLPQRQEYLPTILVAASIIIVAIVVSIGVFICFKKRRNEEREPPKHISHSL